MPVERERLDADVLIVGAGPAGLACALYLSQLIEKHNASGAKPELSAENIYVLEKAREIGAHQLSGAVMDPRGLAELVPDWEKTAPLESAVTDDAAYVLTSSSSYKLPITPPPLQNHGNYIVSLNKLVKWLGGLVEKSGVNLFTQFSGRNLIYEGGGIAGVITEDKGVDKEGRPKDNFTPGYELRAKVTVLAEGPRGSLTKEMVNRLKLDGLNPQVYGIGIKELWDVPADRIKPGFVAHTLGWPLDTSMYGGGWLYGLPGNRVSVGMVIGLDYHDPRFDPHAAFQRYKTHPFLKRVLEGGKMVRYGAKTVPYGGWYSMPRQYVDGGLIIGDSASLLNSQRLKGIHIAIKSGMLAAETVFEALKSGDSTAKTLSAFPQKIERSWIKKELWAVRNFHQGFQHGLYAGLFHAGIQFVTGGRGLIDPMRTRPGHEEYQKLNGSALGPERFKGDGSLTFDRLTDVYHSGTRHEEDQPCHLIVSNLDVCATKCVTEYGNPCQYFCPAAVYEMVQEKGQPRLKINASNCVHCKTCDIADPYEIITWVPPEGGGGPNYEGM
ncbi:MAG TPA: electron transfer flavoprotein-ubiquinone oxidoreductase [Candidatus Saccharimonadales bacterium]|jgi:electron-transferring-flavoprotein dehydrogenase|nr:electron transfer flavoprotein-ubiquinone oxidoreductase [Candidatus Saccharimonadales bacterium]